MVKRGGVSIYAIYTYLPIWIGFGGGAGLLHNNSKKKKFRMNRECEYCLTFPPRCICIYLTRLQHNVIREIRTKNGNEKTEQNPRSC